MTIATAKIAEKQREELNGFHYAPVRIGRVPPQNPQVGKTSITLQNPLKGMMFSRFIAIFATSDKLPVFHLQH